MDHLEKNEISQRLVTREEISVHYLKQIKEQLQSNIEKLMQTNEILINFIEKIDDLQEYFEGKFQYIQLLFAVLAIYLVNTKYNFIQKLRNIFRFNSSVINEDKLSRGEKIPHNIEKNYNSKIPKLLTENVFTKRNNNERSPKEP